MPFTPSNNSMEPPPLRFAKHPRWGRGSSTDPGQPGVWLRRDTSLGPAGRLISRPLGGAAARLSSLCLHSSVFWL